MLPESSGRCRTLPPCTVWVQTRLPRVTDRKYYILRGTWALPSFNHTFIIVVFESEPKSPSFFTLNFATFASILDAEFDDKVRVLGHRIPKSGETSVEAPEDLYWYVCWISGVSKDTFLCVRHRPELFFPFSKTTRTSSMRTWSWKIRPLWRRKLYMILTRTPIWKGGEGLQRISQTFRKHAREGLSSAGWCLRVRSLLQTFFTLTMSNTEIRPGDDEGSVEVVIAKSSSEHVLSANLLISGKFPID